MMCLIKFCEVLPLLLLLVLLPVADSKSIQGIVLSSPRSFIFLPGITPLPIKLTCDATPYAVGWIVNSHLILLFQLTSKGYDHIGNDIVLINNPKNDSEYICLGGNNNGQPYHIFVAGVPAMVPYVTANQTAINVNEKNVTLTLNWGEPFNNLDPILSYTLSCSGDVTCPQNFTTSDATTREYSIKDLTPMTKFTFSVVATNSIGNGEAGVQSYITAGVPAMVPYVTANQTAINVNEKNVTLTLNWGEPFNNLDLILSYTLSCSGDVTCPPNFTTSDATTREYTIKGLTPMTKFTFSVVATNSIGNGEAGVQSYITAGTILPGPRYFIFHPGITPLPIQLTCEFAPYVVGWKVNNHAFALFQLASKGYDNIGNNILIYNLEKSSEFFCTDGKTPGKPYYIFVAGVPAMVPYVRANQTTINANERSVTLTLNWGEPFNNFDPILSYTLSCSGDVTCPPNFTTSDATTREYTIKGLTPMTKFTFSVVATNSIGNGEAGVQSYITAGTILPGPRSFIFHPGITPLPIQLTCEFSPYVIGWKVNNHAFALFQLASNGYDIIGNNLLINNPKNNSEFFCTDGETPGQPYYIFIAGTRPMTYTNLNKKENQIVVKTKRRRGIKHIRLRI